MVKRIIPGNMSPWECEINDVKYVYPPGTEQMVPDEVAHVIDAWYASQEPKYPEPVQPEGGGGSGGGGGAQPDWNAADGEPGHILNRTHHMEKVTGFLFPNTRIVRVGEGAYVVPSYPVELITGEKYTVSYGDREFECEAFYVTDEDPESGAWVLGNIDAVTGVGDSGHPFAILISTGVGDPLVMFNHVQFMDLAGNNNLNSIQIAGPHYRRKRMGLEWTEFPGSLCKDLELNRIAELSYAAVKPFLACGGDLTIRFYDSQKLGSVLLRCMDHDSEKAVFENMQIKNGTIVVSRLTAYADGTPTEYTTESYGLTAN